MSIGKFILFIPRRLAQGMIVLYQKTLSLDHGPLAKYFGRRVCRYHPTCSEYGYAAIGRFGFWKGGLMTMWRIMRCNPWSKGGDYPVPEK
jgi:uncharacterized protein